MSQILRAKKSLGQHFLTSKSALAKIIEAANIVNGETILEIGPGTGILTQALIDAGAKVTAVEKDSRALELLTGKFKDEIAAGKLSLLNEDILEVNRQALQMMDGQYALIANIPYYITGAILQSFLEFAPRPNRMVLLVQKEVAERIIARDGKGSLLSNSVKVFGEPTMVAKVPRGAFNPPPTVDSAILSISNISNHKLSEMGLETKVFFDILKAGFAHKRKVLKRNLEAVIAAQVINEAWQKINLDDKVRAEDLKLTDWLNISSFLKNQPSK